MATTTPPPEPTPATEPEELEAPTRQSRIGRPSRRTTTLVVSGVLLIVFVVVAALLPVPYVLLGPGPTFNTLGSYDGKALITVSGHPTYPTSGNLNLVTVSESGGPYGRVGLADALRGWIDPHIAVVPTSLLYAPNTPTTQVQQQNQQAFSDAESSATVAALNYLHIPYEHVVKVTAVTAGGPSVGVLQPGDVIVAVNGARITSIDAARAEIQKHPAGKPLTVTVQRDGTQRDVTVVPRRESEGGKETTVVGVTLTDGYSSSVKVTYSLTGVGGPSAGMMFSLGLVDKLTPGSLNGGKFIAGTGTIDADGTVGEIGGIQQKMQGARSSGATFFLVPAANCQDALGAVPKGLTIAKVTTLASAVSAIGDYVAGKPAPAC